uniref:Peroxidase n=1 Tax=Sipha flava TaxID=143950 RepID=A0A2S2QM46_9HEMI
MDMVGILLFAVLVLGGSHAFFGQDAGNARNESAHVSPGTRCIHAVNPPKKNHEVHVPSTQNDVVTTTNIDERVDPNPSKIPSLMDPSSSIGLLPPSTIDLADQCFPVPRCDSAARFRTIDGGCNNLRFPVWGRTNTAHTRIVQAHYSDGTDRPRRSTSGHELPNSRHIRTTLFRDLDRPAPKHSLYAMQFGQIIAHDTEFALPKTSNNGSKLECCRPDGTSLQTLPKNCLPIKTPNDDPGSKNRCFTAPRTLDTADRGCNIKPVRQVR